MVCQFEMCVSGQNEKGLSERYLNAPEAGALAKRQSADVGHFLGSTTEETDAADVTAGSDGGEALFDLGDADVVEDVVGSFAVGDLSTHWEKWERGTEGVVRGGCVEESFQLEIDRDIPRGPSFPIRGWSCS